MEVEEYLGLGYPFALGSRDVSKNCNSYVQRAVAKVMECSRLFERYGFYGVRVAGENFENTIT